MTHGEASGEYAGQDCRLGLCLRNIERGVFMSRGLVICFAAALGACSLTHAARDVSTVSALASSLKDGDLVFHESKSGQSRAIRLATKSRYTHVGIVRIVRGRPMVLEAVRTVRLTPFKRWQARGVDGHIVVKRLREWQPLTDKRNRARLLRVGRGYLGKRYDGAFAWDEKRIYCSELVYRIYKRGLGIELGTVETFGDMDLSSPVVQKLIKIRRGKNLDLHESIITPVSIFEDPQLFTVARL